MTQLFLVRHGPTHAKTMVGWSDLPADLGDTAALARLSAYLPDDATVVSSDLCRATATADAIQGTRPRLPHQTGLREIHFGTWEMRHHTQIEAEDPERFRAYWEQPGHVSPPGGESWYQTCARVDAAVDALIDAHKGARLVIVAHFGMILTQVQRALQLDPGATLGHRIDNLSVTELTRLDGGWKTGRINHIP